MALQLRRGKTSRFSKLASASFMVFALFVQPLVTLNIPSAFATTGSTIDISTVAELRSAIENQQPGQTWTIEHGNYGLLPFNDINTQGQTGWYFPITASNLTITGIGNPIIYGTGYTPNGNWSSQNFVSVFGDNVTINGLTLMPKVEPNKTIEVLGSDFTFENSTITPNTLTDQTEYNSISDPGWAQDAKQWGGSLYFSHAGNHTIKNVTINNAGISYRYAPTGTNITFTGVKIVDTSNVADVNSYRYSSGFNNTGNTVTGTPSVVYHVSAALNNLANVLSNIKDGDTIELDSDLTVSQQLTLTKAVNFNGNGHTLTPDFTKSNNDNNSVLAIQSDNVTVNNLHINGTGGTNLHGINIFQSNGVTLNDVSSINNSYSGVNVNASKVTVTNITTANNGWHGIDVDKVGAVLTIDGVSHQTDILPVYVDNVNVGQVIDTGHQYNSRDNRIIPGDRVYDLKLAAPTTPYPGDNAAINTNNFWFTWSTVNGAVSYEWQGSQSATPDSDGNLANVTWTGDYQKVQPTMPTAHSVGASGTWYWQVRAVDANGVKGLWSPIWNVTVDTTKPAVPTNLSWIGSNGQSAQNGITNIQKGTLSWKDTTPSDVDHYVYKFWTNIAGYYDDANNPWTDSYSYVVKTNDGGNVPTNFADKQGTYYFCVEAVDKAGNNSGCSNTLTVTYDATAPVAAITSPIDGSSIKGVVSLTGTISDANPMNSYFSIYNSNGNVVATSLYTDGRSTHTFNWNTASVPEGKYTIYFEARDKAGNKDGSIAAPGASVKKVTVTVDRSAPVIAIVNSTKNSDGSYTISGTTNDNTSSVVVSVNGVKLAPATPANGVWSVTTGILASGTYPVTATSTDAAGNPGTATPTPYSFTVPAKFTVATTATTGTTDNGKTPPAPTPQLFTSPLVYNNDGQAVLGTQTASTSQQSTPTSDTSGQDVKGTSDTKSDTNKSNSGLFGLAWYWWALLVAAIAAIWWFLAARRRRNEEA